MPIRSLRSSVLTWPDRAAVEGALRAWTEDARRRRPELLGVGYIGSYARGDWGPGSDLDVVLIAADDVPFETRGARWDTASIPVPVDLLVYTPAEWAELVRRGDRFAAMLEADLVWLYEPA
jgi:uncharacterized protein